MRHASLSATGGREPLPFTLEPTLPALRYHDFAEISAAFTASAARVRALLPSGELRPVLARPGRAVVLFAAMEYRKVSGADGTPWEPYNELAVLIPVLREPASRVPALPLLMPDRFPTFGFYVHHLPVTTREARDAGIEVLGAPKFIAEISFTEAAAARACRLRADGRDILALEVSKPTVLPRRTASHPQMTNLMYTVKDGRLLRWQLEKEGEYGFAVLRGGAAYVLGDHPVADGLRQLDLGRVALQRSYAPRLRGVLSVPGSRLHAMHLGAPPVTAAGAGGRV